MDNTNTGNTFDWTAHDPAADALKPEAMILVGPTMMQQPHETALQNAGLSDIPQIAVDGGMTAALGPFLWVGDGDSGNMPEHIPAAFKEDQNLTDLRFCLNGIANWRWTVLHLIGFFGERRDHEMANFGELYQLLLRRPQTVSAVIYDLALKPAVRFMQAGQHDLTIKGRFSVLVLEAATISISGACQYAAENLSLAALSGQGISNEGSGLLHFSCDKPFMVLEQ